MDIHKRALSLFLSFALVFSIFGMDTTAAFAAQDSGAKNSGLGAMRFSTDSAKQLDIGVGSILITEDGYSVGGGSITDYSGPYCISGNTSENTITVESGNHDITISHIGVIASSISAFSIAAGATVNLTLNGENYLKSDGGGAGLQVPRNASLTIGAQSAQDSLDAIGGRNSAGIGGSDGQGGSITINGGTVTANGGSCGAGIGGGDYGAGGGITINGGMVTATGGTTGGAGGGAGIGGGSCGAGDNITIKGGIVKATGKDGGAGIGGGHSCDGGNITTINGGTVTADSDGGGADIGGGTGFTTLSVAGTADNGPTVELQSGGINAGVPNNVAHQFTNCKIFGAGAKSVTSPDIGGYYDAEGKIKTSVKLTAVPNTAAILGATVNLSATVKKYGSPGEFSTDVVSSGDVQFTSQQGVENPTPIGSPVSVDQSGKASFPTWTPGAGTYTVAADYSDTSNVYADGNVSLSSYEVQKGTPAVSLDAFSAQAGDSAALTATVTGVSGFAPTGNVTFYDGGMPVATGTAFTPVSGSPGQYKVSAVWSNVPAGTHTLTAAYSGDGNYNGQTSTGLSYNVSKKGQAPLSVTGVPTSVEYGGRGFHLNAAGGSGNGGLSFSASGSSASVDASGNVTITGVGDTGITVKKAGDSTYNPRQFAVTVHVVKGTPRIKTALSASAVSGSQLSAASVSGEMVNAGGTAVSGTFAWAHPDTVATASGNYEAVFTPDDSTDYNTVSANPVHVNVTKTTPTVTTPPTASQIPSGSKLSASTFTGGVMTDATGTTVSGTFAWAHPDTVVTASGNYEAVFTPDRTDYNTASVSVNVTVTSTPAPTPQSSSGGSSQGTSTPSLPPSVTEASTGAQIDLSGATFPAGVTGVSLAVTPEAVNGASAAPGNTGLPADPQSAAVYHLAITQAGLNLIGSPFVYNIKLLNQNGNPITSFTGSVTVKVAIPAGIHGTPHIFRYEDSTGTFTDLGATVENGFLVFQTSHFSYYVIAGTGDSVTLDTKNYQIPVNGKYQIGLKLIGKKATSVKAASTNDKVAAATRLQNGNVQVTAKGIGTAYIMIDVYDNKNHLLTHASVKIDVKTGIRPKGDSTRQIGVF